MTSEHAVGPSLEDLEAARETVSRVAEITPMQTSRFLTDLLGQQIYLKCENLQRTGSYKIRGAYNRLSKLSAEERARGVVAASAGNHAQGVALAARELGIGATIFMPVGVPLPKLQATRNYGAEVVLTGTVFGEVLAAAQAYADETGAVFIPPYDHIDVITGQGTLGLEIYDEVPELDTVVVPIGGGGLIAGVAAAVRQRAAQEGRTVRVIGVQAANSAAYPVSLEAGEPTTVQTSPTIADGIAVARPGTLNFDLIRDTVDEVVTVSEDDIARALVVLLERAKLVVEPAGAVGVAAILAGKIRSHGNTALILSGGNIDPQLMQIVVNHGLVAAGRYLKISIPLPDRPGQLSRIADLVAHANANVIEVLHTRHGNGLQIGQVELRLSVETRGTEHRELVLNTLQEAGYAPRVVED